jgi:hypothetical protein
VDAIRYLLRATIAPDPRKTLTDSVTTASAISKALSSNTSDKRFKSDAGRPRARRVLIANPISPSEIVPSDWWIAEDQESEDLMICYSDREHRTRNQHRETHGVRMCWTCWLPGHFSEECPVVSDHLSPEIAVRKQKALTELRRKRSEGKEGRQPGWYQPRPDRKNIRTRGGSNHAAVKSDHSSAATSKNGNGGYQLLLTPRRVYVESPSHVEPHGPREMLALQGADIYMVTVSLSSRRPKARQMRVTKAAFDTSAGAVLVNPEVLPMGVTLRGVSEGPRIIDASGRRLLISGITEMEVTISGLVAQTEP